jgi:hypothetical protein
MASRRPRHAAGVRPRYPRVAVAGIAATTTAVAVLGATGLLSSTAVSEPAYADAAPKAGSVPYQLMAPRVQLQAREPGLLRRPEGADAVAAPPLPSRSGEGKRVVFDMTQQQVWLVSARDRVRRTYPVSGSLTDNLAAGTYEVYSRSVDAIGIDDSGTMKYMVRFAHGERAAIGFHDIPVAGGERVQTRAQLGTPQSHGCIRQWRPDAKALWDFAPVGTTVVVVA